MSFLDSLSRKNIRRLRNSLTIALTGAFSLAAGSHSNLNAEHVEADGTDIQEIENQPIETDIVVSADTIPTPEDMRQSIVEAARQYIGLHESGGDNKGPLIDIFLRANQTGSLPEGQAAPSGSAWCAGFASYILATVEPELLEYTLLSKNLMKQAQSKGAFYKIGQYTPQPGDLIFFERGNDGDWRGHVGFIESVDADGTIHTIEGNKNHPDFWGVYDYKYDPARPDGVRQATYTPSEFEEARILGFGNMETIYQSFLDSQQQQTLPYTHVSQKSTNFLSP